MGPRESGLPCAVGNCCYSGLQVKGSRISGDFPGGIREFEIQKCKHLIGAISLIGVPCRVWLPNAFLGLNCQGLSFCIPSFLKQFADAIECFRRRWIYGIGIGPS
ncbi:MAG: hypothetical protein BWY82_01709 [Verrucomicrobia bacterium ADurb.Bin474]|nr:MAG: hypothetical protein BWY82_01709 [Verrucomicrobia bacterium ADurb.Bin474]